MGRQLRNDRPRPPLRILRLRLPIRRLRVICRLSRLLRRLWRAQPLRVWLPIQLGILLWWLPVQLGIFPLWIWIPIWFHVCWLLCGPLRLWLPVWRIWWIWIWRIWRLWWIWSVWLWVPVLLLLLLILHRVDDTACELACELAWGAGTPQTQDCRRSKKKLGTYGCFQRVASGNPTFQEQA